MSSARRGSKCELTSPDGHISSLDDETDFQLPQPKPPLQTRRRCKDLSAWNTANSCAPKSPTDVQGPPPHSPKFKFPAQCCSTPTSPSRKSTSDLTELQTATTSLSRPSSPRGSVKGLAYLASRRSSARESSKAGSSVEDLGPLNFQASARLRNRRTSNFLELPAADHSRPRVSSLPERGYNPRCGDELYRLRTFSITNKGVVMNYGDSIIDRRSRSNTSVNTPSNASKVSPVSPWQGSCCSYNSAVSTETLDIAKYRVVMLGDAGVGKTALVSQFMTSEYMNTYDASLDDEFGERTVSVLLDGEESEIVFIDHPSSEMSVENSLSTYEPHACVVVYSVVNKGSLRFAEDVLNYLWRENYTREKSVILVANKSDLERARVVTTQEGKSLAASRECKFIETSGGIQHNVDELLVGILKQIRLREAREKKKMKESRLQCSRTSLSLNIAKELLQRMCIMDNKSKSCENLHVLLLRRPQSIREEADEEELREITSSDKSPEEQRSQDVSPSTLGPKISRPGSSADNHKDVDDEGAVENPTALLASVFSRSPRGSFKGSAEDKASRMSKIGPIKETPSMEELTPPKSPLPKVTKSASLDTRYIYPIQDSLTPSPSVSRSPSPRLFRHRRQGAGITPRRSRREAILKPDGEVIVKPSSGQSPKLSPKRLMSKRNKSTEGTCMAVLCQGDTVKCSTLNKMPSADAKDTCTTYV